MGSSGAKHLHDEEAAIGISLGRMRMMIRRVMHGCAGEFIRTVDAYHS